MRVRILHNAAVSLCQRKRTTSFLWGVFQPFPSWFCAPEQFKHYGISRALIKYFYVVSHKKTWWQHVNPGNNGAKLIQRPRQSLCFVPKKLGKSQLNSDHPSTNMVLFPQIYFSLILFGSLGFVESASRDGSGSLKDALNTDEKEHDRRGRGILCNPSILMRTNYACT